MGLQPYQFQLYVDGVNDVTFGRNTKYPVSKVNIASYNVNNQDFQVARSNETRMGIDTRQPQSITFTMGVIDSAPINNALGSIASPLVVESMPRLSALQRAWKAKQYAENYGALTYISYCDGYGSVRRIYGRPRKFQYTRKSPKSTFYQVSAEFARADNLTHDDNEVAHAITDSPAPITRRGGDADCWLRMQLTGPMATPAMIIGGWSAALNIDIAAGQVIELSSYPWARYIIDVNTGINYRPALTGNSPYLDQMTIPPGETIQTYYTATGLTAESACTLWYRDAYNII